MRAASRTPRCNGALTAISDFAAEQDGVTVVTPYENPTQISEDGTIAFTQLDVRDRSFTEVTDLGTAIEDFGEEQATVEGVQVEYGGDLFGEFELPESEVLGIIAAVIILILAFGSVLAMGLPIGIALFGLGIASALVSLASHVISMPDFTTAMVAMIGLGVGIDYALFIVTRFREGLKLDLSVEESIVEAVDTSGRAVLFAGITVIISLLGLSLIGLSFVTGVAIASTIGVLMMIFGSLTLLPALLGWIGARIDNTTRAALIAVTLAVVGAIVGILTGQSGRVHRRVRGRRSCSSPLSFAIKPLRTAHPAPCRARQGAARLVPVEPLHPAPAVAEHDRRRRLLLLLAIPLFSIRLGFGDYGNYPEDTTVRRAYDLLAEGFGPGYNGRLIVTVEGDAATDEAGPQPVRRHPRRDARRHRRRAGADQRRAGDGRRVPGERPAGRRDHDARPHAARRRHPADRDRRQGRRLHRRLRRLLELPRASGCRCSSASCCCSASCC